jgi:hypothetical protein
MYCAHNTDKDRQPACAGIAATGTSSRVLT